MKTNGSMICRQQRINNAISERQTPWVYPLPAAPLSHPPALAPLTPSHIVPSHLYWRRWLLLLVNSCNRWLAASSPVFGKPSWSLVKWSDSKTVTKKNYSVRIATPDSCEEPTGVSLLAALTRVFAVILDSATALSYCHPHVCPFLLVLFHSPPTSPPSFVMWKGPAGRTGLTVERLSILIH